MVIDNQKLLTSQNRRLYCHCLYHVHGKLLTLQAQTFKSLWTLSQRL